MRYRTYLYINGSKFPDAIYSSTDRDVAIREILHYAGQMIDNDTTKVRIEIKKIM